MQKTKLEKEKERTKEEEKKDEILERKGFRCERIELKNIFVFNVSFTVSSLIDSSCGLDLPSSFVIFSVEPP
jgi:uncharacterized membrane protein